MCRVCIGTGNDIQTETSKQRGVKLNRVGGWVGGWWVVGRVCLKIKKDIY